MNTFNLEKEQISSKGITLIALVITIIVLLILAGISIAMLTGENGILTKADTATRETKRQEVIEKAKLDIFEYEAENEGKITDDIAYGIIAKYDKDYKEGTEFKFKINENEEEYNILVSEVWKGHKKIQVTIDGVSYKTKYGISWIEWVDTLTEEQIENLTNSAYILFQLEPTHGTEWKNEDCSMDGLFTSQVSRYWIEDSKGKIPFWGDELMDGEVYTTKMQ